MRRLRVFDDPDYAGVFYRKEDYMRDPELREAFECGVKEGWRQAMEEQYGYGERHIGRNGMGYRHDEEMDDDFNERRYRSARTGRFVRR